MIKEITVTRTDFKTFYGFACYRLKVNSRKPSTVIFRSFAVWFVIAVALTLLFNFTGFNVSEWHWQTAVLTALPFGIFIAVCIVQQLKLYKAAIPREGSLMLGKRTIEFTESGIQENTAVSSTFFHWSTIDEVLVYKQNVYIFIDTMLALIFPASIFDTTNDADAFARSIIDYQEASLPKTVSHR